jgi:hypothetical protein
MYESTYIIVDVEIIGQRVASGHHGAIVRDRHDGRWCLRAYSGGKDGGKERWEKEEETDQGRDREMKRDEEEDEEEEEEEDNKIGTRCQEGITVTTGITIRMSNSICVAPR